MRGLKSSLGLGSGLPGLGLVKGAGVPSLGVARLLVPIGDSNATGTSGQDASSGYVQDAMVRTLLPNGSFTEYTPVSATGIVSAAQDGRVGPEMKLAQRLRTADPSKPVFICKNTLPGSLQTGVWRATANGGTMLAPTFAYVNQAIAAMTALGYTPEVHYYVSLGINDTGTTPRQQYLAEKRAMLAEIVANGRLTANSKVIQNRVTLDNSGTPCIRAAQQIVARESSRDFLINSDGFGKIGDVTHYNMAGLIALGDAAADILLGVNVGVDTDLMTPTLGFYDKDVSRPDGLQYYGFNLNTGWSVPGDGSLAGSAVVVNGASTSVNDFPFEAGASYQIEYDLVVTAGQFRWTLTGGTQAAGTTQSTSGHKVDTIVANASNVRFAVNSRTSAFTGSVSSVVIRKL